MGEPLYDGHDQSYHPLWGGVCCMELSSFFIPTLLWGSFPGGGGVHDLRMDGGLPPGFQKGTLF